MIDNTLKVRVNPELLDYYKGNPDLIKEALTLYIRSQQNFLNFYQSTKTYEKESN